MSDDMANDVAKNIWPIRNGLFSLIRANLVGPLVVQNFLAQL